MAILTLALTLKDNRKKIYKFKTVEDLAKIDPSKEAEFLFRDFRFYAGFTDGKVDSEGFFTLTQPGNPKEAGFPIRNLIGWRYKRKSHNLTK